MTSNPITTILIFLLCCFFVRFNINFFLVKKAFYNYKKSLKVLTSSISFDVVNNNNSIDTSFNRISIEGINLLCKLFKFSLPYFLFFFFLKFFNKEMDQIIKLILPALPYFTLRR